MVGRFGLAAKMTDSDNPATPIKAMVEAGNVTIDVASIEYADAIRLCDEGMLEPIDINALPPVPMAPRPPTTSCRAPSRNAPFRPTSGRRLCL